MTAASQLAVCLVALERTGVVERLAACSRWCAERTLSAVENTKQMSAGLKVMLLGLMGAATGFIASVLGATTAGPIIGFASCVIVIGGIAAHQLQKRAKRD